jgi:formamidopyrimidine-DNA glycosylase
VTELPQVEAIRKDLEREVIGKRIKDVTVKTAGLVARHRNRPEFVKAVEGRKIEAVARRGVHLTFDLDGDAVLVLRLGDRGTVVRETATAEPGRHTQVVATFTTGGALHYVDPDKSGELFVIERAEAESLPELSPSGFDPLATTFTWHAMADRIKAARVSLRALLDDAGFIVGLGDVYADEILWAAGLSGTRPAATLSSQEIRRLYRAVFEVLGEAVKQGAESGDEDEDEDVPAPGGSVYGREGQPCPRCRTPVRKEKLGRRITTYYCPQCQT